MPHNVYLACRAGDQLPIAYLHFASPAGMDWLLRSSRNVLFTPLLCTCEAFTDDRRDEAPSPPRRVRSLSMPGPEDPGGAHGWRG